MTPNNLFDIDPDRLDRQQLSLYDRLIADFAGPERRSAEGKWLTGAIIRFVKETEAYKDHDFPSYPDWIRRSFPFDVDQAERYVQIAALPRELLRGVEADVHRLVAVRNKPEIFWPPLIQAAGAGASEAMLTRAARSGKLFLLENQDVEAACEHVLAVALGDEAALTRPKKAPTAAELGRQALRLLGGKVRKNLAQIRLLKQEGKDLRGPWADKLRAEVEQLNQDIADLFGPGPAQEDQPPAAAPARPEAENPRRENRENPKQDSELDAENGVSSTVNLLPQPGELPFYVPVLRALGRCLDDREKEELQGRLFPLLKEAPPLAQVLPPLAALAGLCRDRGHEIPPDVFDLWLAQMKQPDWERRGIFVLGFMLRARMPGFRRHLYQTAAAEGLPPGLHRWAFAATKRVQMTEPPTALSGVAGI